MLKTIETLATMVAVTSGTFAVMAVCGAPLGACVVVGLIVGVAKSLKCMFNVE